MAKVCSICGKTTSVGHKVSHAQNKTKRKFKPNIRKVKVDIDGGRKTMRICAKCLKAEIKVTADKEL